MKFQWITTCLIGLSCLSVPAHASPDNPSDSSQTQSSFSNTNRLNWQMMTYWRSAEDYLPPVAAKARTQWAYECGHYENPNLFHNETVYKSGAEAILNHTLYKFNYAEGIIKLRARPQYPIFTNTAIPGSSMKLWVAPSDIDAPCDVPEGYKIIDFYSS
jgi:hypothetical protein